MSKVLVLGLFVSALGLASPASFLGTYECSYYGGNASESNLTFSIEDKHFIKLTFRDGSELTGFGLRRLAPNGKSAAFRLGNIFITFHEDGRISYLDNWNCQKK